MTLPLEGIRILDLSIYLPGPLCCQILADFGAEVIKIEDTSGEFGRWAPPLMGKESALFYAVNRNKKSISLNLKTEEGKEIFKKLVTEADILLEQFRPGVMDKIGLGYEQLKNINRSLIYCAITGYGCSGPLQYAAGHDLNYLSIAGITGLNGNRDAPAMSNVQVADIGGGTHHAVMAILLALMARSKTGEGQFCDVSMLDGAVSMLSYTLAELSGLQKSPERGNGLFTGHYVFYNIYKTSDNKYVSLGAIEAKFWSGFCTRIGRPEFIPLQWADDKQEEMIADIRTIMMGKTQSEWVELFSDIDICFTPVLNLEEMCRHPQIQSREMIISLHDFNNSGKTMFLAGIPVKLSATPGVVKPKFSQLGEHNTEILLGLGYSENEINQFRENKIIT